MDLWRNAVLGAVIPSELMASYLQRVGLPFFTFKDLAR